MCSEFDCVWPAFMKVLSVFPTIVADVIVTVISGILVIRLFVLCVEYYAPHTHENTSDFTPGCQHNHHICCKVFSYRLYENYVEFCN
jgi:hypothetical protein